MSGESFSVDTDGLQAQMPYMEELAQRFRTAHKTLEARLDALGECWGDDATGEQFSRQYLQPKEQILEATGDAADVLTSTGDGLRTMAHGFQGIEAQNTDAARQLGDSIGTVPPTTGGAGGEGRPEGSGRS